MLRPAIEAVHESYHLYQKESNVNKDDSKQWTTHSEQSQRLQKPRLRLEEEFHFDTKPQDIGTQRQNNQR